MAALVTSDLHLSANPRDAYRHDILRKLYAKAERMGIDHTFILGDLTEEKDRHNDWLVNKVVEHITRFAKLGPVIINKGNHDYFSDPDMPFFRFLRHLPGVRWVGEPTYIKIPGIGRTLWLPHTRSYQKDWANMSFLGYEFIFAHGTFAGARLGSRVGDRHRATDGIPLKLFAKSARIISGDVHVPQKLGPVTYVGAPYAVDFGDAYQGRVLTIGSRNEVTSIDVDGPQKRLVEFDGSENELDAVDDLIEGDILKIRISVPRKAAPNWPEQRDRLRAHYEKRGYVVHSIIPVITEDPGERVMIKQRDAKSDQQVFLEFARHRGVDKATARVGEKLLLWH